jgi:hypothetical protein
MTLLYVLLRAESDKRWYQVRRGSIFRAGSIPPREFATSRDRWLQVKRCHKLTHIDYSPLVITQFFSFQVVRSANEHLPRSLNSSKAATSIIS